MPGEYRYMEEYEEKTYDFMRKEQDYERSEKNLMSVTSKCETSKHNTMKSNAK